MLATRTVGSINFPSIPFHSVCGIRGDSAGFSEGGSFEAERLSIFWCFSNPQLAVFLIDRSRSAAVVKEALGDSLPGVLVTDF